MRSKNTVLYAYSTKHYLYYQDRMIRYEPRDNTFLIYSANITQISWMTIRMHISML